MKNYRTHIAIFIIAIGSVLFFGSCDEVFPSYSTPENVLSASISLRNIDTINVFYYVLLSHYSISTPITLDINIVNNYDDLLQGDAQIGDRVTVQTFGKTPTIIVFPLTLGALRTPSVFRGALALAPHDTAQYRVNFIPLDKKNIPAYVGTDYVQKDSTRIYGPIEFIANADVRLFERVQSISTGTYKFKVYFKEYMIE